MSDELPDDATFAWSLVVYRAGSDYFVRAANPDGETTVRLAPGSDHLIDAMYQHILLPVIEDRS